MTDDDLCGFDCMFLNIMNIRPAIQSQYHAALKTIRLAIEKCPDALWNDSSAGLAPIWQVAYHSLFFSHFYLQQNESDFTPWEKHREDVQCLPEHSAGVPARTWEPYTRSDLMDYWKLCDGLIDTGVDTLDLSADQCGFPWYKMSTLEHQLLNIRHLQHHAAILSMRLRQSAQIEIPWIGSGRSAR